MKHLKYLLCAFMALTLCLSISSCSKDDDDEQGVTEELLIGGFWDECDDDGNLLNDKTEYEVHHMNFNGDGTGSWYICDKGENRSLNTFYWTLKGDMLTIIEKRETETIRIFYCNGILIFGEIYYKKRIE